MSSVARIVVISQWNNLSNQTMNKTICFSSEKTDRKREREPEGERDFINLLISPKKKKKNLLVSLNWMITTGLLSAFSS